MPTEKIGDIIGDGLTAPANPDCTGCDGHGTVTMDPAANGWHLLTGRTWRVTDGTTFTFPGDDDSEMLLVALCPACYPSHYSGRVTIN
jgi:hypothetical protein